MTATARSCTTESVPDLVKQLTEQTKTLARQEIELAKAELTEKGKKAGLGAGHVRSGRRCSASSRSRC